MKKLLNKISVWLYKKTREETKSPKAILDGIEVLKSPYISKGKCIMGEGEANTFIKSILDQDIIKSNLTTQKEKD